MENFSTTVTVTDLNLSEFANLRYCNDSGNECDYRTHIVANYKGNDWLFEMPPSGKLKIYSNMQGYLIHG